ncbi:bifunctional acetate--CoA ligase family protein/GNAT family N-acetyltransferase [Jeongeupia chitinilytica]|uniref:GCN5 family N-acetyltransferase n=1 Tax=Jeongeupia chitinilytica TaxID=1041641 RepID=A0ABQ3H0N5_9NEIS|nr:acetate--CoA ligase family protein [Jeongeupia chitinilytica]GHD62849.1 GCN5 family N-acetyltransferase [Jeongeupia chitinilytica]
MTIRNLEYLLRPQSVALIGASEKAHSVGATVLANLLGGGFGGPIMAVNPKYESLAGVPVYPHVDRLPAPPDLAVICTPPSTIPELIEQLGDRGTTAAIVLTAGLARTAYRHGQCVETAMLAAARPRLLRILGPNCVGVLSPGIGLNASFAHANALSGKLAFVSQSGALTTAVLDWANAKGIGFSHFISVGDCADVDIGDLLDYLASDAETSAILLYIESIRGARKFMSAARAAARNKPVVMIKAGRVPDGARAATSHTGALAGADDVYDAAIRRAGMLRVATTEDLFDAVETLARVTGQSRDDAVIVTNGGGAGVMTTDALIIGGGRLASLSTETMRRLGEILPASASAANPVDIGGDAPIERYVRVLKALLDAPETGTLLFVHAPTAIVPSAEIAAAILPLLSEARCSVFACWLGSEAVSVARRLSREAGVPVYDTPERAVQAFQHVLAYRRNQDALMETPPSLPQAFVPDQESTRSIVSEALAERRSVLTEPEAKAVLAAYGIATVRTRIARDDEDVERLAAQFDGPVAIKILSSDITHKSDVGGVALDLATPEQARLAAQAMSRRIREQYPQAQLNGFTVQPMAKRAGALELIVGVATDRVFGPVLLFGHGGTAAEVIADRAVALPPLNLKLAAELVSRTRVAKLLAGFRNQPPADLDAIHLTLVKLSQLVCDLPELVELDINPLLADAQGVLALDARIVVAPADAARMAIRPYPQELEETLDWDGWRLRVRPVRPDDEAHYLDFFAALTPEDMHFRFFATVRQLPHSQLARMTQIDYDREMGLVALVDDESCERRERMLGMVQAIADPDNVNAEFAIAVRSNIQGHGLGGILLGRIIDYSRGKGTTRLVGEILRENIRMVALARDCGFRIDATSESEVVRATLELEPGSG